MSTRTHIYASLLYSYPPVNTHSTLYSIWLSERHIHITNVGPHTHTHHPAGLAPKSQERERSDVLGAGGSLPAAGDNKIEVPRWFCSNLELGDSRSPCRSRSERKHRSDAPVEIGLPPMYSVVPGIFTRPRGLYLPYNVLHYTSLHFPSSKPYRPGNEHQRRSTCRTAHSHCGRTCISRGGPCNATALGLLGRRSAPAVL